MVPKAFPEPSRIGARLSVVASPPENRLGGDRRKVMIPATLVCADGTAHACVIRDMSPAGAKIAVSRRHPLPLAFSVVIPGCDHTYPVTLKWKRGDFAGVVLDAPTPEDDAEAG